MDWSTGLVTGVTRAHLAARAGVSERTVSRLLAWAYDVELLVCVETGATAEFLGTDRNRSPPTCSPCPPASRRHASGPRLTSLLMNLATPPHLALKNYPSAEHKG